jgi:RNAse H-fold protein YqgF
MNKVMGLDLGSKTLGIALSDLLGMFAHGLETFRFEENKYAQALKRVIEIVKQENIKIIVLGLPKHMNGDIGERANISIEFKKDIENALNDIEVILVDERLTTKIMNQQMIFADVSRKKRKQIIDKMAAVAILQGYLDSK